MSRDIPLCIPEASFELYAADTYWQEFFNRKAVEGETSAIENITEDVISNASTRKVFDNGTIYILRDGEKYAIDGRKVN